MGVYETRSGEVVEIIDARGEGCGTTGHAVDAVVLHAGDEDEAEPAHIHVYSAKP